MSGLDLTTFDDAMKEHYTEQRVRNMTYSRNPAYAMIPKYEKWTGDELPIALVYGNPQGRSATFTQAQARGDLTGVKVKGFKLTRVKDYSVATIDNEAILAAKGDAGSFVNAHTATVDGTIRELSNDYAIDLFRSGYGSRGVIAVGGISSATITLETASDIANFEEGMEFVLAESESGHVLRDSGDSLTIIAVNRSAGTFTANSAISDIASSAAGDHIFIKGDRQNSATPDRLKIAGFQAWVPDSAPGSTLFFNVNRSTDTDRLGGLRADLSNMPIEEALIEMEALVGLAGGAMDHVFLHNRKMAALKKSLGTKVSYVDVEVTPQVSFRGVEVQGDNGVAKVFADRSCQYNKAWGLQLDTWKLYSIGSAARVIDTDGLKMLRQTNQDGVEIRYGGYLNLGCAAPGWNINATI